MSIYGEVRSFLANNRDSHPSPNTISRLKIFEDQIIDELRSNEITAEKVECLRMIKDRLDEVYNNPIQMKVEHVMYAVCNTEKAWREYCEEHKGKKKATLHTVEVDLLTTKIESIYGETRKMLEEFFVSPEIASEFIKIYYPKFDERAGSTIRYCGIAETRCAAWLNQFIVTGLPDMAKAVFNEDEGLQLDSWGDEIPKESHWTLESLDGDSWPEDSDARP